MAPSGPNPQARGLPSVSKVLETDAVQAALHHLPRPLLVDIIREEIDRFRKTLDTSEPPTVESIAMTAVRRAKAAARPTLRRAINATGIVLHTGLGRAVLAPAARQAVLDAASGHSTLEIDEESGRRGARQDHVSTLLRSLTGAESALVVNNNAGATFLAVTALAAGREVIISRGELVEIGGSFRMPDIIRASGATLVEVGTTNRTRLSDYESAVTERTGLILRCHPSNFKITGFTEETPSADLALLGKRHGIAVMDDLGSGSLLVSAPPGTSPPATLRQAVFSGCDVVTASGDKLLGGPQAGIILGTAAAVRAIASHPLARALRVDKLTLAALEATLRLYLDEDRARREIPTLRYIGRTLDEIRGLAERLKSEILTLSGARLNVDLVDESSQIGGGSLPGEDLPTICIRIRASENGDSAESLAASLRAYNPPVIGRIREGALLLDPRTLEENEISLVAAAVSRGSSPVPHPQESE